MGANESLPYSESQEDSASEVDLLAMAKVLAARWRFLASGTLLIGALALGVSFLLPLTFTARTVFIPPQQQQSTAASALASLNSLAGLAGGAAGIKNIGDQYVALMQSTNIEDPIVERFGLMSVYSTPYRSLAREALERHVRITLGKKDGLITLEADAGDPQMAANIANQYVIELRRLASSMALTEAQQRRAFFEAELKRTHAKLIDAQQALQSSGFNAGALRAEPKATAEEYAKLQATVAATEVRLQMTRRTLADSAPEVQQQLTQLNALKAQLSKLESTAGSPQEAGYITRYRDFKYQEALFEIFSKQFEMARLDESRESALIQVVDVATPPDRKSKPHRSLIALAAAGVGFLMLSVLILVQHAIQGKKASQIADQPAA